MCCEFGPSVTETFIANQYVIVYECLKPQVFHSQVYNNHRNLIKQKVYPMRDADDMTLVHF